MDFVARYGGEEFCLLLSGVDASRALIVAEKLRVRVEASRKPVSVTASFGVCAYAKGFGDDASQLIAAADEALYEAKRGGRNAVVISEGSGMAG